MSSSFSIQWRPAIKALGAFIVGLVTVIGVAFAIYKGVEPSGPPSFSSSNIGSYANAGKFLSFLSQHEGQKVKLDVTCIQVSAQSACAFSSDSAIRVYGNAAAASCWNSGSGGPCSNAALITLGSGTLGSNGAGDYFIPEGNYVARNQGSGGNVPEGDADYTLDVASPSS
jgi:hypothetical protein